MQRWECTLLLFLIGLSLFVEGKRGKHCRSLSDSVLYATRSIALILHPKISTCQHCIDSIFISFDLLLFLLSSLVAFRRIWHSRATKMIAHHIWFHFTFSRFSIHLDIFQILQDNYIQSFVQSWRNIYKLRALILILTYGWEQLTFKINFFYALSQFHLWNDHPNISVVETCSWGTCSFFSNKVVQLGDVVLGDF